MAPSRLNARVNHGRLNMYELIQLLYKVLVDISDGESDSGERTASSIRVWKIYGSSSGKALAQLRAHCLLAGIVSTRKAADHTISTR